MAIKDGPEYVKFVTERIVTYMEMPKEERRRSRTAARSLKEPWLAKWFGWAPYGLILWWRSRQKQETEVKDNNDLTAEAAHTR